MNEAKRLRKYKRSCEKLPTEQLEDYNKFLETYIPQKEEWHKVEMEKVRAEKKILEEILEERKKPIDS